ncbi:metallophosphoesterase [Amycolatopsis acidiphila]|uniref:Metallophosphoesterase n=1 Tax=Amycolatopsis acidiphila TaxID=715473 RepID=A0A557ZZR0_9PSEU|nr:metallophosphoesterase [Amycolatopsis acidiphila]TVT17484.1 metallophosphoesterase [Amycolatopsis acidiphila]UIJ62200.1 metallophosphoesterase [Amycolatopsis acidiphila]GHG92550.1 metallophosphoesterase [Amycolatopsis acidiphila]
MIRVAAVGDVHLGEDGRGRLRPALDNLAEHADVLLLAGDLTRHGAVDEARVAAEEFSDLPVPVVAVLGNHDYHGDAADDIAKLLEDHGIRVLEGDAVTLDVDGKRLGVAGVKGFGGGFAGKCASNFGEREMKAFVGHTIERAERLRSALESLDTDVRIALTHYSPIPETLRGEPPEIYPFVGCYQLGEVIDECGVALAVHGHAHFGCEQGVTPGGVRVRNVAQPMIRGTFATYGLGA